MLVLAASDARAALAARPVLDRAESARLAASLFPGERLEPLEDGDLSRTCPPHRELLVGCFPGVSVLAAREFGVDYPSRLARRFIEAGGGGVVTLHAMHSVVDWFAYAVWERGVLVRSLSLSPDSGVMEDIGARFPFEEPFWAGEHPAVDPEEDAAAYPFPFHPLDLGEAALRDRFGYQLEGFVDTALMEPSTVPLLRFRRVRSAWWKFWR